jgi:hypothetical protein
VLILNYIEECRVLGSAQGSIFVIDYDHKQNLHTVQALLQRKADMTQRHRDVSNDALVFGLETEMLERRAFYSGEVVLAVGLKSDRACAAGLLFGMIPNVLLLRRIRGSLSYRSQRRDAAMVEMARRAIERRRKRVLPQ